MIEYHNMKEKVIMKKIFDRHAIREYWQRAYQSVHNKISRGAEYIKRMTPWARGEYWRQKDQKK
jgi:hypothetical protein